MPDCINESHPDYSDLLNKTGLNNLILNAKISAWQDKNNSKLLPTSSQLLGTEEYFDYPLDELVVGENNENVLLTPTGPGLTMNDLFQYPIGELTAYKLMKEQMLKNATERIRILDNKRKNDKKLGIQGALDIANQRKQLSEMQTELETEIDQLNKVQQKSTTVMAPLVERDLQRASFLSDSLDPAKLKEAKEITDFIAAMGEFIPDEVNDFHYQRHPIYTDKELANVPEDERAVLKGWQAKANAIREILSQKRTQAANDILDKTTGIEKGIDIAAVKKIPLKDTNVIDMMVMDITHGIFSHNGILTQAAASLFSSEMEIAQAAHRVNDTRIDELNKKVKAALKDLKAAHPESFSDEVAGNHTDYSIFIQKNELGMYSNGAALVERFTPEYNRQKRDSANAFRKSLRLAYKTQGSTKERQIEDAYNTRFSDIRTNEYVFDPRKITAIRENSAFDSYNQLFSQISPEEIKEHEDLLRGKVGEAEFDKRVSELSQHIQDFLNVQDYMIREFMRDENITTVDALSPESKVKLERFNMENDPFILANSIITGRIMKVQRSNGWFNVYPKAVDNYVSIAKNTEAYDSNFKLLQENEDLREFYNIASDITSHAASVFPVEYQNKIQSNSLHYLPKTGWEILFDNDGTVLTRIYKILQKLWTDFISTFGMESQSDLSFAHKNYITGEQNYRVNSSFITGNQNKIEAIKNLEIAKFKEMSHIHEKLESVDISSLNDNTINYIKSFTGINLMDTPGSNVNIYKLMEDFANHQMMMNSSMNLPKILKMYSNLATQYEARQKVLPLVENLMSHYFEIKNTALNNVGQDVTIGQLGYRDNKGERANAKSQFESWFNNQVLDNRGIKEHEGAVTQDIHNKSIDKIAKRLGRATGVSFSRIRTAEEKRLNAQIKAAMKGKEDTVTKLQDILATPKINRTEAQNDYVKNNQGLASMIIQQNNMGRFFSVSTVLRGAQKFLVAKLLGLNISSAATNFIEGQISNSLQAALGDAYPQEYANYISPGALLTAGVQKKITGEGKMPEEIWILDSLIHRYDLFNDIGQELNQSSTASIYDSFAGNVLMKPTRKVEYLNQGPLIASMLRDTSLVGKDGTTTHIFDAMVRKEIGPKKFELALKDNFDTIENRTAWLRDFSGLSDEDQRKYNEPYQLKKNKINEAVKNAHGDYSKFSNMKIKDTAGGQAFMTMRTWLPRQLYMRFAIEQDDIMLGVKGYKGISRSHTTATAAALGGLVGLMTGGVGLAVGAGAALAGVNYIGTVGVGKWGAKSNASTLNELGIMSQIILMKMLGNPINTVVNLTSWAHGKKGPFKTNGNNLFVLKDGKIQRQDISSILINDKFTKRDFQNFKTNLTEISNILLMYALYFGAQLFMGGDDDDDKNKWKNLMVNRAMQLTKQATTYYNIYELGQQVNPNNTAVWKFFSVDVAKFVKDASNPSSTQSYGQNSGSNKVWKSFSQAFIPGIGQSPFELGFSKQFQRQFEKSPLDKLFWSSERKAKEQIREIRAGEKLQLEGKSSLPWKKDKMTPEEANKALKKRYGSKNKNQSYEDYLKEIETVGELPEE